MKKILLSFVCLLAMALPSLAATKTYQLVTDPEEILNPDNEFIMVTATPLGGGIYAAKKTTSATISAVKILESDSCPNEITVDVDSEGLGLFSIKENGDYYALYENVAPRYWGAGTSSTNMAVSTSLPTSNQYQISLTIEENAVKMIAQKTTTRYFAFQLNKAGTTCVVKNYASSNLNGSPDSSGNTYSFPLFYKEVDESLSAVQKVEIDYQVVGVEGIVSLTCPTEGAKIFYGFSEDSMNKEYIAPFTVTENCTVYAYAEKDGEQSNVNSLAIDLPYTSFKDVLDNASSKEKVTVVGNFQVIRQAGQYLMLTDGTSNMLVYNTSEVFTPGDKISSISAVVSIYNNLFELTEAEFTLGGEGAEMEPRQLTTFEGLNYDDNLFDYVIIKGCNISGKDGKRANIELEEETIEMYDTFGTDFENGMNYDITGFVWRNKDVLQIVPDIIEGGVFVETVETPVISPDQRELKPDDQVTITCVTDNVNIYYTLDDSDPTEESTLYEGPFAFTGDQITLKARAYYAGTDVEMLPSEIASHTYHVWDPYCNVITATNHDGSATSYVAHTHSVDGVDYAMNAIHSKDHGIQMNNKTERFCYLIQTGDNEGLSLKSIVLDYEGSANNNVSFTVRGSNKPFVQDEAAIKSNGVVVGTITPDSPSVDFEKDYNYFALYPAKNALVYLNSITINYRDPLPLTNPAILGLEDLDENNVMYDEEEERYFVMSDHALDIDFDVDSDSDVQVMYVLTPIDQELTEEPQPQVYDGSSIAIEGATALEYWAVNEKTKEETEHVTYVFMISSPLEAPAMLGLDDASVEGDETCFLVEADHALNITFDLDPEAFNVQVVYTMSTAEDEDDADEQVYAGEPIVIDKDCEFSYYAIDMSTGNRSEEINYMFEITLPEPVAPQLPELKAEGAQVENGFINCKDNLTINFEVPEGIHVYYSLGTAVDAPKKAHGDADAHKDFTKHDGEDIELTGAHKTLSFYACDPATGLHSDTTTYTLNIATGIADIDADDPDAIYFNLQGVQIAKPENGLYIRVQKGKSEKMMK